jgi:hypothetical protein
MMLFKGVLASLAGPAPNYDMQRILATRNPREASLMNGMVSVVLMFPRYMMTAGITVLALTFCLPQIQAMAKPGLREGPPVRPAVHPDRRHRVPPGGPRRGVHVELRRHAERRPRLRRERHLQEVHQLQRRAAGTR